MVMAIAAKKERERGEGGRTKKEGLEALSFEEPWHRWVKLEGTWEGSFKTKTWGVFVSIA